MKKTTIILAAALLALAACKPSETPQRQQASKETVINGAGATFPYPIYSKWFDAYAQQHPNVKINYQSIGSGGGIKQLAAGTVFFGATDAPMTDQQLAAANGAVLHFPTVLGAVVPIYNVPGVKDPIRFTGPLLADIYLGKIKKWNDPAIAKANPGAALPNIDIVVVHRSDGSGTTFIFCDFLSKVSPEYKAKIGANTSVNWPAGVGAKGNEGVSGLVRQTPGAIGYVELIYATQNNTPFGPMQNAAGEFVTASLDAVSAAAASATMPDDFRVSITNAPGKDADPLSSFTWLLLRQNAPDKQRTAVMKDFLRWALTEGQKSAPQLHYAPLPGVVVEREMAALGKVQ